jgi:hypothetical protein
VGQYRKQPKKKREENGVRKTAMTELRCVLYAEFKTDHVGVGNYTREYPGAKQVLGYFLFAQPETNGKRDSNMRNDGWHDYSITQEKRSGNPDRFLCAAYEAGIISSRIPCPCFVP